MDKPRDLEIKSSKIYTELHNLDMHLNLFIKIPREDFLNVENWDKYFNDNWKNIKTKIVEQIILSKKEK